MLKSLLGALLGLGLAGNSGLLQAASLPECEEERAPGIWGNSQGFFEVRHRHAFHIPLEALVALPANGYSARSTSPLFGHTDFNGLKNRTNADGSPLDLSQHAHTVTLSREQLVRLAKGQHVTVELKKFGHSFYFVADDATLEALHKRS